MVLYDVKTKNQLELKFSKCSELYDIVIKPDNYWRQLNDMVDFSFVYEELKDKYSFTIGITYEDVVRMFKYLLLKSYFKLLDRGNEFKNKIIEDILIKFDIQRSLSQKGTLYDNAVAEATYKIFKTEFCFNRIFNSFEQLELDLFDYVHWFNNFRIHNSLGYFTIMQYKSLHI